MNTSTANAAYIFDHTMSAGGPSEQIGDKTLNPPPLYFVEYHYHYRSQGLRFLIRQPWKSGGYFAASYTIDNKELPIIIIFIYAPFTFSLYYSMNDHRFWVVKHVRLAFVSKIKGYICPHSSYIHLPPQFIFIFKYFTQ